MNDKQTAVEILEKIGGAENVLHLEHCSTRLRFTLRDEGRVDMAGLKAVPGVLGVVMTGQCQVVIGNRVIEVYDQLMKLGDIGSGGGSQDRAASGESGGGMSGRKWGAVVLDFIVGVFQPLIPAIAGAGILKSFLLLFNMFGWMDSAGDTYRAFMAIADAAFYFLPLLVAVTTANKLKCNRYVALSVVGTLLLPALTSMIGAEGGLVLFGMTVQNLSYAYQVFPALLAVLLLAPIEKFLNKYTPGPIRVFFVPLISIVIVAPVTLLLLAPLGYNVGQWFTSAILFLFDRLGWIAVTLLAVALPFMIATGMHKAFVPYAVSSITELGKELLYLPASLAHNISESGACFAVAIRTRNKDVRSTGISAGISALFGITEPALYGLTMQNKRTLSAVLIGSGAGALYIGLTGVEGYVAVGPGLASLSMFVSATLPRNIVNAAIGAVIAFGAAFLAGVFLYRDSGEVAADEATLKAAGGAAPAADTKATAQAADAMEESHSVELIFSPMDGTLIPLSRVKDDVFSGCVLGDGVALLPKTDEVRSPVDGIVEGVFDTGHAITLLSSGGAEILIHVGLDTVKLGGKYYKTFVKKGQRVSRGDLLMQFDRDKIRAAGFDTVTPIVVSNSAQFVLTPQSGEVHRGDLILTLAAENTAETHGEA